MVDDNSPDGTADVAEKIGSESAASRCCAGRRRRASANAYRAGFGIGIDRGYDVICQMDADLSHDPASLPT